MSSKYTNIRGMTAKIPLNQRSSEKTRVEEEPLKRSPQVKREQMSRQIYASLGALLNDVLETYGPEKICNDTSLVHVLALRKYLSKKMNNETFDPFSSYNFSC